MVHYGLPGVIWLMIGLVVVAGRNFRIGIRVDSQPGAAGFEHTHLN
jgi:hypothetical protein